MIYMASVRRRQAHNLARAVAELEKYSEQEDFTAYTFSVFNQLKTLIADLTAEDKEGNAREILRQLRNSFLDCGWEQYRKPEVRQTAVAILNRLAEAEEVVPQDVKAVFKQLLQIGLNPVGSPLPPVDEEDEQQNVEKEKEVSR